jgi:apolipoprotein N-acyltransferase
VAGVFGVSALVASVGAAMAYAAIADRAVPGSAPSASADPLRATSRGFSRTSMRRFGPLAAVFCLVLATAAWGSFRIRRADLTRAGDPVRVGLVQGNVVQSEKWDDARATAIFSSYVGMTRQAIANGAQVIIWPESATPFYFEEDRIDADVVRRLAREARVPILLGSDQIERGVPVRYYNSAFLVAPDGSSAGVYRKMHLVPFGEYVPLKHLLFFVVPLVETLADFSAGESAVLLPVKGHLVSTAICYEIVYPELVRQFTRAGSEMLTTITNDAWFGDTSAPYQHFEQASMRAIENGRYLVRSANTGISGIVDAYGHVVARSRVYEPAVIVGEARFLRAPTVYMRIGDAFAYAAAMLTAGALLFSRRRPFRAQ